MKSNTLIEVLLPAVFIISVTLITYIEFGSCQENLGLISFLLCSIIVCKKYKESVFWGKYWSVFKFPFYVLFTVIKLLIAIYSLVSFQLFTVVVFGCLVYYMFKFSYYCVGIHLDSELLLYLSITMSTIYLSFDRKIEISANKGIRDVITRMHGRKCKKVAMRSFEELVYIYDIVTPKYSSDKMRFTIYFFYFILLVLSNISPHIDGIDFFVALTNSKVVNGSILTYLAFDNLYQNRKVVSDINKRNFFRIVKVAIAKSRRVFYPKKT